MAQIIKFPDPEDREWKEWEESIRRSSIGTQKYDAVVADALPKIKGHWEAIFEPITLELPKRPVPGSLSRAQAVAIQAIIDSGSEVVVHRLRQERTAAMERIVELELKLSFYRVHGMEQP